MKKLLIIISVLFSIQSFAQTKVVIKSGGYSNLTLTTTGTSGAATLTGDSLNIPQYSGGGTTADSTLTMSGGETSVTFSSVPADYSDYSVFYNGMKLIPEDDYTTSGNVITLAGGREAVAGDRINYVRIK